MYCELVKSNDTKLSKNKACHVLGISKTWYAANLNKLPDNNEELANHIRVILQEFPSYGYRPVTHELRRRKITANHKLVLKTMQKHGLTRKKKRFRICTTDSNHGLRTYPNLIKSIKVVRLNQVWVGDITYIHFANGETAYLATLLDRLSRKCIGWQLSRNTDAQLCLDALIMALNDRQDTNLAGLTHHSDQGVQYASNEYIAKLEKHSIRISMSRRGNPYDNAHAESFFKTIKYEEVYMDEYQSFSDAYQNIKHFIEEVYNKKRLHSSIGYKPPAEFEQQYALKEVCT